MKAKNAEMNSLKEVTDFELRVSGQKRYSSKDCLIISNATMLFQRETILKEMDDITE